MKHKWLACPLALAVAALAACQGGGENALPQPKLPPAGPRTASASTPAASPQGGMAGGQGQDDPLDTRTAAELSAFLEGQWTVSARSGNPLGDLVIKPDGTYRLDMQVYDAMSMKETPRWYEGAYTLKPLFAAAEEAPDLLRFSLKKTNDDALSAWTSIGDYTLGERSLCDGEVLQALRQANNGESVFSMYTSDFELILRRPSTLQTQESVRRNSCFEGCAWKTDVVGETVYYWIDHTYQEGEFLQLDGHRESVRYEASSAIVREGMQDIFLLQGAPCEVETDAAGRIVRLLSLEPFFCPEDEDSLPGVEPLLFLDEVQAALAQGMWIGGDGYTEEIEGETCAIYYLASDNQGESGTEAYYAISPSGEIYTLNRVNGGWEPLGAG